MKTLAILAAVGLSATFIPVKAPAKDLILNVSGAVVVQKTESGSTLTKTNIETVSTLSFNNKFVYNLISNAVATGSYPYLASTNLPKNGHIAFAPTNAFDANVVAGEYYSSGVFYVTNKEGFYWPLNGYDSNNQFYSYIEINDDELGFFNNFYGAVKGSESRKKQTSTYTEIETSELFIHDDPYSYDAGDRPDIFKSNDEYAIEMRTHLTAKLVREGSTFVSHKRDVSSGGASGSAMIGAHINDTVIHGHYSLVP